MLSTDELLENSNRSVSGYLPGAADKRRKYDFRRVMVLNSIFRMWVAAGLNLTVTTDYETSERRGVLIDFVNEVVALVTSPPARINGETIRSDLKRYKSLNRLEIEELQSVSQG